MEVRRGAGRAIAGIGKGVEAKLRDSIRNTVWQNPGLRELVAREFSVEEVGSLWKAMSGRSGCSVLIGVMGSVVIGPTLCNLS